MADDIKLVDLPDPVEITSFYADEETTYAEWLEMYGKDEADRLADRCGIPTEKRKAAA